ncbi:3-dehydroquinate synthase [Dactylosporangium roseum]
MADTDVWPGLETAVTGSAADSIAGVLRLRGGEAAKSLETWRAILEWLAAEGAARRDIVVAVGGGTISDVVGYAASAYLRGVPYVNVPTTLLAQADGAIGGKVAINLPGAKNAIGGFHHPTHVVCDVSTLATLPVSYLREGFAEIVKVAVAEAGGELFEHLERGIGGADTYSAAELAAIVRHSVQIKLDLLRDDPFEKNLRRILNFGHTVAHSLESATGYVAASHGSAVAIGLATACRYGVAAGLTPTSLSERIHCLLDRFGLPTSVEPEACDDVIKFLDGIRRARGGNLLYVVPRGIGDFIILDNVDLARLSESLVRP